MPELDRDRARDAAGVPELLLPVAPEQLGGVVVTDPVGEEVVEVFAAAFELVEQLHRGDVELLDPGEGLRCAEEVEVVGHARSVGQYGRGHADPLRR